MGRDYGKIHTEHILPDIIKYHIFSFFFIEVQHFITCAFRVHYSGYGIIGHT